MRADKVSSFCSPHRCKNEIPLCKLISGFPVEGFAPNDTKSYATGGTVGRKYYVFYKLRLMWAAHYAQPNPYYVNGHP